MLLDDTLKVLEDVVDALSSNILSSSPTVSCASMLHISAWFKSEIFLITTVGSLSITSTAGRSVFHTSSQPLMVELEQSKILGLEGRARSGLSVKRGVFSGRVSD